MSAATYVGVGLYTYPEAARIIGVDGAKLRRWASDYYHSSRGQKYQRRPVIERSFPDEPILTFQELIELLFIRIFREEGVTMPTIRRASERASSMFGTSYPFAVRRFDTDGKHIFATLAHDDDAPEILEDIARGQLAFETVVRPFFKKLEYSTDASVLALWPREQSGRVVLDPERRFGKPIDSETGVPTVVLFEAVKAAGEGGEQLVADWYEVPVEAVIAAIAYEESPSVV